MSLYLIKHFAGEWSASRPGHFTPMEMALGTHWTGDWVGPGAGLDAVVETKKIAYPARNRTPVFRHGT